MLIEPQCCARRARQAPKAHRADREMQSDELQANVITYNAFISTYEKDNQLERAFEIFTVMRQRGMEPSVITYSALISACEKGEQPERGLVLQLDAMMQ